MFIIVNPVSGNGKTGQRWAGIEERLRLEGAQMEIAFSQEPGHATYLAGQAVRAGERTIVSAGGDGTLNEVLNGLAVGEQFDPELRLGIIPSGTGTDFVRGLGLTRDPLEAALRLLKAEARCVDVGRIRCRLGQGEITRFFINAAGLGFDGEVCDRVNRSSKVLGGTTPYLAQLLLSLFAYRNKHVRWALDGQERSEVLNSIIVANCRYFGGGMHVSPHSQVDDGLFHVITLGDLGKIEFLVAVPRVYNGSHLSHPKVKEYVGREIRVEAAERMFVQAEGELVGEAPATFTLLPGALHLLI
ncbi:MAG: diacylglycerol kinase family lipid kinase [Thermoflexales bacterium]|nr:diacylglycerol kinase family lipid kinase [Thermoflexales bacterium]